LGGADDDDTEVVVALGRGRDERLEQIEPGVHGARGQEDLRYVVLVPAELLADDVHPRNEPLEDEQLRVEGEVESLPGLARDGVRDALDRVRADLALAPGPYRRPRVPQRDARLL